MAEETTQPNQEHLKQDNFDDFLFHTVDYIYRKRVLFISIGVAVAVLFVLSYLGYLFVEYKEGQRNEALYAVEKQVYSIDQSDPAQSKTALGALDEFIAENEGTKQAVVARFLRGNLYFKQQNLDLAQADFSELAHILEPGSSLSVMANIYLANVLKDQKKYDEAINVLESSRSENLQDVVLMEVAETYHSIGKQQEAKKTLEILIKDYPNSGYSQKAQNMLTLYP